MEERKTKICRACGRRRKIETFYRSARAKDGRNARCNDCCRTYRATYYAANPERFRRYRATARAQREAARAEQVSP